MKKIRASIISLAMVFVFASTAFPLIHMNSTILPTASVSSIRYTVTVNLPSETVLCGHYLVIVIDAAGKQVAPAQSFDPGVLSYTFYEVTRSFVGIRTARMIYVQEDGPVCKQQLTTPPESMFTYYMNGETYLFNLYPSYQPMPH
jgi:hypothetical protein